MDQTSVGIVWFFLSVLGQVGASISGEGSASVDLEVDAIGAVRRRTGPVTIAVVGCMEVVAEIVGSCTEAVMAVAGAAAAWILLFGTPQPSDLATGPSPISSLQAERQRQGVIFVAQVTYFCRQEYHLTELNES